MFETSIPQDYGINESIALVTDSNNKKTEVYQRIKHAFAKKLICFQDVTLDEYKSVTLMQEDNRYAFPFLVISDGLTREILKAEEALKWIADQEQGNPKYNGFELYFVDLPYICSESIMLKSSIEDDVVESMDLVFVENDKPPQRATIDDSDALPFDVE
jgi:hypothetical protein